MSLLDDMATVLSTNAVASSSGSGVGWYLWKSRMPDSTQVADRAVALIETGGYAPEASVDVDKPGLWVRTRGAPITSSSSAYEEARTKAAEVQAALHAMQPGTVGTTHYVGVWAEQSAFFAGYDDSERPVFSQNFRVQVSR